VTARARLRALRLVGFKSFAERTTLEFGPGISAVVGPNGSGKSNLADALRWALGEQGRSLRTRRSEDVIFAGSARRHATGMADVSLVIDNEDRLLPIDYGEVDLGRRLYRSGENEYLLNRQSIRLRDLVDLLDSANLADNAFLFIGQGMVDQALSLRPEERRPLFEEAAGVRRHERRRRQAEERLVEAEANLARLRDILGELRPQARRLAAQAEQQIARRDAAAELAEALVAAARARWSAAAGSLAGARDGLASARRQADVALRALIRAEEAAADLARGLAERGDAARLARGELETIRGRVTELRLGEGRSAADSAAAEREALRLEAERTGLEARMAEARRAMAVPLPAADAAAEMALAELDAALAAAAGELGRAEEVLGAASDQAASLRRAFAVREAEAEALRRRAADAARQAAETRRAAEAARGLDAGTSAALGAAEERLAAATAAEMGAVAAQDATRHDLEAAEGRRISLAGNAAGAAQRHDDGRARLAGLEALAAAGAEGSLAAAARRRGGRLVAEGLDVEPALRTAVEAVLGEIMRTATVQTRHVVALRAERGHLLLTDGKAALPGAAETAAAIGAASSAGGGALGEAIRRDTGGHVTRLLRACLWVPDLPTALALRPRLPFGWRVVTPEGEIVGADGIVTLGRPDGILDRRAERDRLAAEIGGLAAEAESAAAAAAASADLAAAARRAWTDAGLAVEAARRERGAAQEAQRVAARAAEQAGRELAWEVAQLERLESAASRATDAAAAATALVSAVTAVTADPSGATAPAAGADAAMTWRARVGELRSRRSGLASAAEDGLRARGAAQEERRRAEVRLALDGERLTALDGEVAALRVRLEAARAERTGIGVELGAARESEARVALALGELEATEIGERSRLLGLEREAAVARERLRHAEDRARTGEAAEMVARAGLDALRESLLVELAGLGASGLAALDAQTGIERGPEMGVESDDDMAAARLEAALDRLAEAWSAGGRPSGEVVDAVPGPTPARIALMRRRYHELGASNPFATEEYAAVRERLSDLEAQQDDLGGAIEATRRLIAELSTRINEQFRTTFAALEGAFAVRFVQLFGGGEASLLLTDPDALAQTGVEIMARPPGKKRQPLAALSGGERALTAVALLFAMLEVRPVPFCVLDEVDAALDEANVDRFVGALRELAGTTQFIVITHNRGTIEAADALYGVTIGDDAVSRVISLRLSEATDLAALAG
jgi:chromosome segregation protein